MQTQTPHTKKKIPLNTVPMIAIIRPAVANVAGKPAIFIFLPPNTPKTTPTIPVTKPTIAKKLHQQKTSEIIPHTNEPIANPFPGTFWGGGYMGCWGYCGCC